MFWLPGIDTSILLAEPPGHTRTSAARGQLRAIAHDRARVPPAVGLHDRGQAFPGCKIVLRHSHPDRVALNRRDATLELCLAHGA